MLKGIFQIISHLSQSLRLRLSLSLGIANLVTWLCLIGRVIAVNRLTAVSKNRWTRKAIDAKLTAWWHPNTRAHASPLKRKKLRTLTRSWFVKQRRSPMPKTGKYWKRFCFCNNFNYSDWVGSYFAKYQFDSSLCYICFSELTLWILAARGAF